ncbi:hypothetical protein [Streptosporangium sp. KLBMP 9127]|nr:hypothetical protein [Streptosporangium sp. KLBMP 9127]
MTQEKYVTSKAIAGIQQEIELDVIPAVQAVANMIDTTVLSTPGWGVLGELAIGIRYSAVQDDVEDKFEEAITVLDSWIKMLDTARSNWRTAEDQSSLVVYK